MSYKAILREIAKQNNTTPTEVEAEIKKAIEAAYADPDPEVRKHQEKIKCKGAVPTPEEFVKGVAKIIREEHSSEFD